MSNFDYIDPSLIHIDREGRQRRELKNIEELAESIRNVGLINPILIDRTGRLVAGERRLTACQLLGLNPVPVQYTDETSKEVLHLVELEENVKREDLCWQDRVRATVEYHELRLSMSEGWTQADSARELGVGDSTVDRYLLVNKYMDDPLVGEADKFSVALNAASRKSERVAASATRDVNSAIDTIFQSPAAASTPSRVLPANILNEDFHIWSRSYAGEPFNLIHCDFPYGISTGDKKGQSAAKHSSYYKDSKSVYFELLTTLLGRDSPRFVSESSHLIFWFSMKFYTETREMLERGGWRVNPYPLIWHKSDNTGIIPDANRGPRNTYETAFFASRGDRKIVRAVASSFGGPVVRTSHTSEKSPAMLTHFLRMLVDDTTRFLDPTCGSGNAVGISAGLGAEYSLGLELDPAFAAQAKENLVRVAAA